MGNDIIQISDYSIYLDLLMQQYKDKEKFVAVLDLLSVQCDKIETALHEFFTEFDIETAIGNQLDIIGSWVGQLRMGLSDTDYRQLIKARVIVNNGSGEPETIIYAMKNIYGANIVRIKFVPYATVQLWIDVTVTASQLNEIIEILPAGVNLLLNSGGGNPFVFDGDSDGLGFSQLEENNYTVDFGAGEVDYEIDFGGGVETLGMLSVNVYVITNNGGEFQTVLQYTV